MYHKIDLNVKRIMIKSYSLAWSDLIGHLFFNLALVTLGAVFTAQTALSVPCSVVGKSPYMNIKRREFILYFGHFSPSLGKP